MNALRKGDAFILELSLVAETDGKIVGHIMFTRATVDGKPVLALAPLSVLPEYQRSMTGFWIGLGAIALGGLIALLIIRKRYTEISELTPCILHEFVEKIVVHAASDPKGKNRTQEIDIYYKGIGALEVYIEYDYLIQNRQLDRDRLDELVELMVDTVCSRRETIRIAGDDYPAEVVKSRFLKLDSSHIEYVLDRMRENTTYVRNIKKYLLAALYNAPATIGSYYTSLVSHDLYGGGDRR